MQHFDPREKIALFIDGANLYQTARALNLDLDYRRLLKEFIGESYLIRAYYYTAIAEDQEFSSIRPLVDWLDYNGFTVITKPMKEYTDQTGNKRRVRPNLDVHMAVDAFDVLDQANHYVFFSGDGTLSVLAEALQRRGRKVTVVSTVRTSPPMVSDELRRLADHFVDLTSLSGMLGRDSEGRSLPEAGDDVLYYDDDEE